VDLKNFRFDVDGEGIATATWDMAGKSMNVIDLSVMDDIEKIAGEISANDAIKGAIITSGKESFSGGADLNMLEALNAAFQTELARNRESAVKKLFEDASRLGNIYRRLETCGKPVVAALNGTAVGGAFELALACHHRIVADDDRIKLGLPEVKVGLMPGAGGTQRVARLANPQDALAMLLKGDQLSPSKAKAMKLVDQVVPAGELLSAAKKWLKESPRKIAPWDEEGFKLPGGKVYSAQGANVFPPAVAIYRRETYDNYPAARAILQCVYEGLQLDMDTALRVESRWFAKILRSPEAAAMIRSLFVSMGELNKGARRPAGVPPAKVAKLGIIGAGFMGAGIASVSAQAGIDVVLIDRDQESADKGKGHVQKSLTDQVNRGRATAAQRDETLARITPTPDYGALAGCDLVIEAVFEDRKVKAEAIHRAQAVMGKDAIFASNTSTLPITSLATEFKQTPQFIGIHFFSPVERMMLVEIIMGKKTGDKALAMALDYVRAIRKTPIVVNDSRGFYANRCVLNYIQEGHLMLTEGVPPAMIENVARMAGMPVGPLSLNDEVAIDLAWKIVKATEADLGPQAIDQKQKALLEEMVEKRGRYGRKNGKGFYDYPQSGPKRLWPGLADLQPVKLDPDSIDIQELKHRLLVVQALEAARTVEDGVITDVREADVGSILGFGFAPYSGGTLSYIDMMGTKNFVDLCKRLEKKHGKRFKTPKLLRDMAAKGETFYGRFAPGKPKAA